MKALTVLLLLVILFGTGAKEAIAQPQFAVTTTQIDSILYRGSFVDFHVYGANSGPENVKSPNVMVSSSDPTSVHIVGSSSFSWYGHYLPPDGTEYDLGEFAFSISQNALDGMYVIRVEVDYGWQGATFQKSITAQFNVQPSQQEIAVRQAAERTQLLEVIAVFISIIVIVAALIFLVLRRRKHGSP
jgi:hypothetical protein